MANEILIPTGAILVDGRSLVDLRSNLRWLPEWVQRPRPTSVGQAAANGKILEERDTLDLGDDWRCSGMPFFEWQGFTVGPVDAQALGDLDEVFYGPYAHNMTIPVRERAYAHTDGTRTTLTLDRAILGDNYTRSGLAGVNGISAGVLDMTITKKDGTAFTKIYVGSPASGEVFIETSGTYALRQLEFNATDIAGLGSSEAEIRLLGQWLYQFYVPDPPTKGFRHPGGGYLIPDGLTWTMVEKGESG